MNKKTLAFPMSTYHLKLLKDNNQSIDIFLLKNKLSLKQFGNQCKILYYKEEMYNTNIIQSWKDNKKNYAIIKRIFIKNYIGKVVLFADNKPIFKFIIEYCKKNNIIIELWEDGLGHYIGSGQPFKYYTKSMVKLLYGFYYKGIFSETFKRDEILVRDRFNQKNLLYYPLVHKKNIKVKNKILFIGQPLIEDGYISKKDYIQKLEDISNYFNLPVDYLLHPREDKEKYKQTNLNLIKSNFSAENYCSENSYQLYLSVFSTTNINIDIKNNYFLAGFFGLKNISNKLDLITFLPIKNIKFLSEIKIEN